MLLASLFFLSAPQASQAQLPPVRERIGGRLGFIVTEGQFNSAYGNGYNATLHFTEAIHVPFYLDIKIGALYLGELQRQELAETFTGIIDISSDMRILFFSVGPQYVFSAGRDWLLGYASLAAGVYSVSVLFDSGIQAFDLSQSRFGGNASIGTLLRFTSTWNLDINVTLHHMRTTTNIDDLFRIFTDGAVDPSIAQFAMGITIDLR